MKNVYPLSLALIAAAITSSLLFFQNCSGFKATSGGSVLSSRVALQAEFNTIVGQALTSKDQPVPEASVELMMPGLSKTVMADSRGVFKLPLTPEEYKMLSQQFSVYIRSPGFAPASADFALQGDVTVDSGENFVPKYVEMDELKNETADIFPLISRVLHLGDSDYGGQVNSQFQYPDAESDSFVANFSITESDLYLYEDAELVVKARGIQSPDFISVVKVDTNQEVAGFRALPSAESGDVTETKYRILIDSLAPGDYRFTLKSVDTDELPGDIDDFELVIVDLRFKKRLPYCPLPESKNLLTKLAFQAATTSTSAQCLGDHAPIHRSVACMAADIVESNRVSTFDYPSKWAFFATFNKYTLAWPSCFVLNGLESKIGESPIVLKSALSLDVSATECRYQMTKSLTPTTAGYANLEQLTFEFMRRILARPISTPLQLYDDAIQMMGGDSVEAFALIGQLMEMSSGGVSLKSQMNIYLNPYTIDAVEKAAVVALLIDPSLAVRTQGYNRLLADASAGLTTATAADIEKIWNSYGAVATLFYKAKDGATVFTEDEMRDLTYLPRTVHPILTRLAAPFTHVTEDFYGQFYHFYSYFGLNYIYADSPRTASAINGLAWAYEEITDDDADLDVDAQARRGGFKLSCFVQFMEDNRDVNWQNHFRCSEIRDNAGYQNAKLIPFPADKVDGAANKALLLLKYGFGCYRSVTETDVW